MIRMNSEGGKPRDQVQQMYKYSKLNITIIESIIETWDALKCLLSSLKKENIMGTEIPY